MIVGRQAQGELIDLCWLGGMTAMMVADTGGVDLSLSTDELVAAVPTGVDTVVAVGMVQSGPWPPTLSELSDLSRVAHHVGFAAENVIVGDRLP